MAPILLSKTGQETLQVHGLYGETTHCRISIIDGPRGLLLIGTLIVVGVDIRQS